MKHFFLINIFLIAALAFILLIFSGNTSIEHFQGEPCLFNGQCAGTEKCINHYCNSFYPDNNFTCRVDSDCLSTQWCFQGICQTKPPASQIPALPHQTGLYDPRWLMTQPNNLNFCPTVPNNFCPSATPNCRYGPNGYYCASPWY
jgi:hypothetical protein